MSNRVHAQDFAAHPLALLAAVFALGVLGASGDRLSLASLLASAAVMSVLALASLLCGRLQMATVLLMAAMLFLGWSLAVIEREEVPARQLRRLLNDGVIAVGQPVEVTGVLARDPEISPERWYLFLKVQSVRVKDTELVAAGEVVLLMPVAGQEAQAEVGQLDLRYGARIRVMTIVERADSFRNPGVSSFTEYLDRQGYEATGFIKSPLLIERLENERVFLPLAWLYEWRRKLQAQIDAHFARETAGVLDAAFLGNRYGLSRSTAERFRDGGTFHVLVISGLHITFLGGLVFLIARRLTKKRALQFLLSVVVLWGYALAVGAESSVVRAALMFSVVLLAPLVSRRASSLNALGGAALGLLVIHPANLLDPSFQLTFVSVLAIVMFAWPLLEKLSAVGAWRPTRETPYPPVCPSWLRSLAESLYWSERQERREAERLNYRYRLFKSPLAARLERLQLQRLLRYTFAAIAVSVCVQLTLLPFLVIYFHRLSVASLVLNIWVSLLLAGVALFAGIALLLVQISHAMAAPFFAIANGLNWTMVHGVDPFASIGAASIRLPEYTGPAAAIYGLYYVPLILLALSLARWQPLRSLTKSDRPSWSRKMLLEIFRSRKLSTTTANDSQGGAKISSGVVWVAALAQLVALLLIVGHPFSAGKANGKLRVDFLDVGQGDAALVTFPDNTTLLIDGGGKPGPVQNANLNAEPEGSFERETRSIGEAVVSEYLWWRGLDQVDYLLATHADADHIDGLNDVARNFKVRAALVARAPENDPEYVRFAKTLAERNIPIWRVAAGDVLRAGGVQASVLWPLPQTNPLASSRNNDSVVLRLQMGDVALLLTGDIEMAGERAMSEAHDNLHAEVIKVGHHGSKTSSTAQLVAAVQPRYAVISVGQTSVFGHPNREVVERWTGAGARVLTTGRSGTITATTDGKSLSVKTFVMER
ncbi:MAG: competence protein ComEC [Pyrinomonadaceae bacterium]|jgi:competence protein ComEC|nr:competence protein ComEC [Pyrinomonadaceae bacterium]